jgi:hypothetical protein
MLQKCLSKSELVLEESNINMVDYLKEVYKVDNQPVDLTNPVNGVIGLKKDVLESIIITLNDSTDVNEIKAVVFGINDSIKSCNAGQVSRFNMVHDIIFGTKTLDSFVDYIENMIATYKN